jgi:hypothetical protein
MAEKRRGMPGKRHKAISQRALFGTLAMFRPLVQLRLDDFGVALRVRAALEVRTLDQITR